MTGAQMPLFEPTGPEVGALAMQHMQRSEKALKLAELAAARNWQALAAAYRREADEEAQEAEDLAMLAEFERLGGVAA